MLGTRTRCFLSGFVVFSACSVAQAQSMGATSLRDLQFTLTDLKPDDGIAPALVWNESVNTFYLDARLNGWENGFPTYTTLFYESQQEAGRWGQDKRIAFGQDAVSMDATGLSTQFDAPLGVDVSGWVANDRDFTLTPFTAVTFSAKVKAHVTAAVPDGMAAMPANSYRNVVDGGAGAYMNLNIAGAPYATTNFGMGFQLNQAGPVSLSKSDEELIFVTAGNKGPAAATGSLYASASFWARNAPPAVPEPSTWAQMALGLALLGGVAAARRLRGATRL